MCGGGVLFNCRLRIFLIVIFAGCDAASQEMTEAGMAYGVLFQGMRFKNINDLIRVSPAWREGWVIMGGW